MDQRHPIQIQHQQYTIEQDFEKFGNKEKRQSGEICLSMYLFAYVFIYHLRITVCTFISTENCVFQ